MKKLDKELDKIKFRSFGKVKIGKSMKISKEIKTLSMAKAQFIKEGNEANLVGVDDKLTEQFIKEQREEMERGFQSIISTAKTKGRSASVFKLKEIIVGSKKQKQEPSSVKDPKSNKEVFDVAEIKKKTLDYCVDLLTNRPPRDDYINDVESKNSIHDVRMLMRNADDEMEYSEDLFNEAIEKLKKKGCKKYEFILKILKRPLLIHLEKFGILNVNPNSGD